MKILINKYLFLVIICFCSFCSTCYAQFKVITTNSDYLKLKKVSKINDNIILCGSRNFLAMCTANCDTIFPINNPSVSTNFTLGFDRKDIDTLFLISTNANSNIGYFYRSTDMGETWQLLFSRTNMLFNSLSMKNNKYGIIAGWLGTNFHTMDGGITWERDSTGLFAGYDHIENIGDSTFVMLTLGFLEKTTNLFQSWQSSNGFGFYEPDGLHILNKDTLMVCSTGSNNNPPMIGISIDGGNTFQNKYFPYGNYLNDVYFKSANEGYIVGRNALKAKGTIYKTIDFGQTWEELYYPAYVTFSKIEFINDSIALLGASNGLLVQWNTKIPITTSVEKIETNIFVIYPNPATNVLTVENSNTNSLINQIFIQNSMGEDVKEFKNINLISNQINLDISSLPSGIYFIKIIDLKATVNTQKFIKLN
jgi:photosystem II stability/assembly factor-like uncharacterized protein